MTISDRETAADANIQVHSALANSGEYNKSPHFRPENLKKVRAVVEKIVDSHLSNKKGRLLDIGCGTGFMINLTHDLFTKIDGIDITLDMMKQVDLSPGNIELHESMAETTPFDKDSFDMVSAYSFLDHVVSYEEIFREAFRVLKSGGVFYSDLNPNMLFSETMQKIEQQRHENLPHIIKREISGMLHNGEYYQENFGIDKDTLAAAEPIKSLDRGFDPYKVMETAKELGFSKSYFEVDWYLGQAQVMHERPSGENEIVESFLRSALPATINLFKYLRFVLVK